MRTGAGAFVLLVALASCGGNNDDSRNAAIFPGNNFEIAVENPYQMQSGPEPIDTDVAVESLGQRFTSNPGPTALTGLSVRVSRTGTSATGPRDIELFLHSSTNGTPGARIARLGSVTVEEGYEGVATVAVSPPRALKGSTEYFIIATGSAGEGAVSVQTALNMPLSNVDPAPEFVSYLGSVGPGGTWLPNETGRNMILTVMVESLAAEPGTTTTVNDVTSTTDAVAGQQAAGPTSTSTASPGTSAPVVGTTTTVAVADDESPAPDTSTTSAAPAGNLSPAGTGGATTLPTATVGSVPGEDTPGTTDSTAPDDTVLTTTTAVVPTTERSDGPMQRGAVYSPADDPVTTRELSVTLAAFAALSAAGAAFAFGGAARAAGGEPSAGRLSTLATKRLRLKTTSRPGAGDAGSLWRRRGTERIDATFVRLPARVGPYSTVGSRVLVDGSWARAMFGSLYLVLPLAAAVAGVVWAFDTRGTLGLPAVWLLSLLLVLASFDALSGGVAALSFTVVSAGFGALGDWSDVRTVLGIWVVLLSPALIGNVVRPLRRVVHESDVARRERALDYVMGPVGTMFAVAALVQVLNGLSGSVLAGDGDITAVKWTLWVAMLARLALEDRAVHSFPERLRSVQPADMPGQSAPWGVLGAAVRFGLYLFVSEPFFGLGKATVASAVLLTLPFFLTPWDDSLPNSAVISRWLPRGFLRFAILLLVGGWLGAALLGDSPTADTVRSMTPWLFVPSAVLGLLDHVGRAGSPWPDTWVKKWGGAALWVAVVLVLAGAVKPF